MNVLCQITEQGHFVFEDDHERDYRRTSRDDWIIFKSSIEIFDYFEKHPEEYYAVYYDTNPSDNIAKVMLFYTEDGYAIFGIDLFIRSLPQKTLSELDRLNQDERVAKWTKIMIQICDSLQILYSIETPPPRTLKEFVKAVNQLT